MFEIGQRVIIDKGLTTERSGTVCAAGHMVRLVQVESKEVNESFPYYLVDLDEGFFAADGPGKGYVSVLVCHPRSLTEET